jgi:N-acetylglucosaminyl-diphospho-decaprenol L-rhamnosyltransferase
MRDLAVIIVSYRSVAFLPACLDTVRDHAGDLDLQVIVADNDPTEDVGELLAARYPWVERVRCENHGFAHGNNRGLEVADARHVLFLNPDTELLEGTLADLVGRMDADPTIGVLGVVQQLPGGELAPTMRNFPAPLRELAVAAGIERAPGALRELGERRIEPEQYARETDCDWVSGSFMLVRREALEAAGVFDERFFLFAEETDLCRRIRSAGFRVVHTPAMRIVHHAGKAGVNVRLDTQMAFARRQYADKHLTGTRRAAYLLALCVRHGVRAVALRGDAERREAELSALRAVVRGGSPYEPPPATALRAD